MLLNEGASSINIFELFLLNLFSHRHIDQPLPSKQGSPGLWLWGWYKLKVPLDIIGLNHTYELQPNSRLNETANALAWRTVNSNHGSLLNEHVKHVAQSFSLSLSKCHEDKASLNSLMSTCQLGLFFLCFPPHCPLPHKKHTHKSQLRQRNNTLHLQIAKVLRQTCTTKFFAKNHRIFTEPWWNNMMEHVLGI